MSASRCLIAWNEPIGTPNCSRSSGVAAGDVEGALGGADEHRRGEHLPRTPQLPGHLGVADDLARGHLGQDRDGGERIERCAFLERCQVGSRAELDTIRRAARRGPRTLRRAPPRTDRARPPTPRGRRHASPAVRRTAGRQGGPQHRPGREVRAELLEDDRGLDDARSPRRSRHAEDTRCRPAPARCAGSAACPSRAATAVRSNRSAQKVRTASRIASWSSSKPNCILFLRPRGALARGWKYLDVTEYGRDRAGATQEAIG